VSCCLQLLMLLGCSVECCLWAFFRLDVAPDTNSSLEKLPRSTLHYKFSNKVVSVFHSGVFSNLLAWVVAIVKRGFGGYTPNAKRLRTGVGHFFFFLHKCPLLPRMNVGQRNKPSIILYFTVQQVRS